jgi:phosphatidylglycerophosphate synthase
MQDNPTSTVAASAGATPAGAAWRDANRPGAPMLPRFLLAAMANLVVVVPVAWWLVNGRPAGLAMALGAFVAIQLYAALLLVRLYPHDRLGLCNLVTQFRAGLIAAFAAPIAVPGVLLAQPSHAWAVLALAVLTLSLDGVDGWLARRSGLVSRFGARFDVEMDSILALILTLIALQSGKAGMWMLILGVARYLFVGAGMLLPWLNADLPERFSRKLVCVIQIATLIALMAPIITPPLSWWLAIAASALLVWSFALDVVWLYRNKAK